jgi:hypothetical protein
MSIGSTGLGCSGAPSLKKGDSKFNGLRKRLIFWK